MRLLCVISNSKPLERSPFKFSSGNPAPTTSGNVSACVPSKPDLLRTKYSKVTPSKPFQASTSKPTFNILDLYQEIAEFGKPLFCAEFTYAPLNTEPVEG